MGSFIVGGYFPGRSLGLSFKQEGVFEVLADREVMAFNEADYIPFQPLFDPRVELSALFEYTVNVGAALYSCYYCNLQLEYQRMKEYWK